jgi:hypothetical protein
VSAFVAPSVLPMALRAKVFLSAALDGRSGVWGVGRGKRDFRFEISEIGALRVSSAFRAARGQHFLCFCRTGLSPGLEKDE